MRKYFLITLTDGGLVKKDVPASFVAQNVSLKPADLILMAMELATNGFCTDIKALQPLWIAPAYIKTVQVVFEDKGHEFLKPNT